MPKSGSYVFCPLQYGKLNPSETDLKRYWSRVQKRGRNQCWMWTGQTDLEGYGVFWYQGRSYRAARWTYQVFIGKLPKGLCACHTCDVPGCVNPNHLWKGTIKENQEDMARKLRGALGDRNGSRLHPEKLVRGDAHHARLKPWTRPRGDQHWTKYKPQNICRGEQVNLAKVTEQNVREIREAAKGKKRYGARKLGQKYGLCAHAIIMIVLRRTWKHVP